MHFSSTEIENIFVRHQMSQQFGIKVMAPIAERLHMSSNGWEG